MHNTGNTGCVIPQLPTAMARVGSPACHVQFVEEQSAIEAGFPTLLGFPCHVSFHQILHIVTRLGNVTTYLGLGLIAGFI
jgi:hypothetical protein